MSIVNPQPPIGSSQGARRPRGPAMRKADPTRSTEVATALCDYLSLRLQLPDLCYEQSPVELPDGWEAYTYRLRFHKTPALPVQFDHALIARIYASPQGRPRAAHEFAVLGHMAGLGYPVPRPVLLEEDSSLFGGPFLIMEEIPGRTLYDAMLYRPWQIAYEPTHLGALHAQLHALPTDGFPAPPGPFLPRRLEQLAQAIREYDLVGLQRGLDWLGSHQPAPPERPSILHLDFQPFNVLQTPDGTLELLDWNEADIGDPHADVAVTLMLMQCFPLRPWVSLQWPLLWVGRRLLRWLYLLAYRRRRPLDPAKLAYYRGWAALRRVCSYGIWLHASPRVTGSKPSSLWHLTPSHLHSLCRYFHKWTGVRISL